MGCVCLFGVGFLTSSGSTGISYRLFFICGFADVVFRFGFFFFIFNCITKDREFNKQHRRLSKGAAASLSFRQGDERSRSSILWDMCMTQEGKGARAAAYVALSFTGHLQSRCCFSSSRICAGAATHRPSGFWPSLVLSPQPCWDFIAATATPVCATSPGRAGEPWRAPKEVTLVLHPYVGASVAPELVNVLWHKSKLRCDSGRSAAPAHPGPLRCDKARGAARHDTSGWPLPVLPGRPAPG